MEGWGRAGRKNIKYWVTVGHSLGLSGGCARYIYPRPRDEAEALSSAPGALSILLALAVTLAKHVRRTSSLMQDRLAGDRRWVQLYAQSLHLKTCPRV